MSRHGKKTAFFLATALLGTVALIGPSACRKVTPPPQENTNLDPLIHGEGLGARELADRFGWMEFHPLGDTRLFFRMRVPRGWQARPHEISSLELQADWPMNVVLAQVEAPDQKDVLLRVGYWRIRRGTGVVKLNEFLESSLMELVLGGNEPPDMVKARSKWVVLARKSGKIKGHDFLEELIELKNAWGLSMVRARLVQQGPLVFLVMGLAPSARYERFRQAFGVATESFGLLTPDRLSNQPE